MHFDILLFHNKSWLLIFCLLIILPFIPQFSMCREEKVILCFQFFSFHTSRKARAAAKSSCDLRFSFSSISQVVLHEELQLLAGFRLAGQLDGDF